MTCAEKKELQEHCMAASNELDAVQQELWATTGVTIDLRMRKFVHEKRADRPIDQTAEFKNLTEALRKWQSASRALSLHLSTHRC